MRNFFTSLILCGIVSIGASAQYQPLAANETTEYSGYLNISMLGMVITEDSPATIEITDNGDGTCDFLLPDLVLEDLGSLGDIELKGVAVTEDADGTCSYSGYEENMQLLGGELIANVSLTGTITADGVVNMVISVIWKVSESSSLPVTVTFTSEKASVSSPTVTPSDDEGLVDVYTITGVKVLEKVTIDQATKTLAKGLYIMGDKKILVK